RTTYNDVGQPTTVDRGSVTSQGVTFPGLTVLERQETGYDNYARPVYSRLSDGTTTGIGALTQLKYDANGRLLCTAVRMNSADFASPPADACAAGATANVPDRIAHQNYDAAGRVLSEQAGYDTTQVMTTASYTYTTNGLLATITNARGFMTTNDYDGF